MARSELDATRELAFAPQGLAPGMDGKQLVTGILVDIDTGTNRALVSYDGSPGVWMTFTDGAYTEGEMVQVIRSIHAGIAEVHCLGPVGGTPGVPLPTAPGEGATSTTAVATIAPIWTGSWRSSKSRYDDWNVSRSEYGGRATLYQGSGFGSGEMIGLALYGDLIKNLGATSIQSITIALRDASLALSSRPAMEFQAATNADTSGSPARTGAVMTAAALGKGEAGSLAVDASLLEGFRTGTYKALATHGAGTGEYNAVRGTSDADGMVLTVNYTRPI
jgi:hypothetical protein